MKKKYNWINDEVKIDFIVPKYIQEKINELEELDRAENDYYFDACEYLECDAKECVVQGVITKKQWEQLCTRYDASV